MENLVKQKYYINNKKKVDNGNFGESRTIHNLLNLIDYKNYKNIFVDIVNKNNEDNNILELGCGLGIAITELCYLCNNNNYYAINFARKGYLATGYESEKYTKEYIISFMKNYGYDMTNKKNIKHYNHDMFKLDIFKDGFFDLIYSQSTIGKSMNKNINFIPETKKLLNLILIKLKINGYCINHVHAINKYNYNNNIICRGTNKLNGVCIDFELFFADNKYCQAEAEGNVNTEVMLILKKISENELIEKKIEVINENLEKCKNSCIYGLFINLTQ